MYFKQLILTALSGFIILIYVNMGPNKEWFERRIYNFSELLEMEMEYNTLEGRREFRWGEPYFTIRGIRQYIEQQKANPDSVLVLLPPQEYCDKNGMRFAMPEPVVCYHFAGLKTTRHNNKDVYEADYALVSINGNMSIQTLQTKEQVNEVIQHYKSVK